MKIYLVGGAVRDQLLGLPVKEKDWVVVGATVEEMLALGYRQVGKEFPVFLHPETNEEYALARMERKVQPGYKGFTFDTSQTVSLDEDLIRRDLTINAMALDITTNEIIDPFGGQADLKNRLLKHVSNAFCEDPVRILRIARFYARYRYLGFTIAPTTINLMQKMVANGEINALVAERVWKELERALCEKNAECFFYALDACHGLAILFPHLLKDGPGIGALKACTEISSDPLVRYAALLHALPEDKQATYATKAEISAINQRYKVPNNYRELANLCAEHYHTALHAQTFNAKLLAAFMAKLDIFRRFERYERFLLVCQAIADVKQLTFNRQWLLAIAQRAKSLDIKPILASGLEGKDLADAIATKREEIINQFLASC